MLQRRFGHRVFCTLSALACTLGCSDVSLRTTTLSEENSNTVNSDAGVVSDTFFVQGTSLFDPCGSRVILRGVNEMVTFTYESKDGSAYFGEIAKTGANSIRIYWLTSDTPDDLDRLLVNAEAQKLIPIIYVFNYPVGPTTVSMAADFWTRSDIVQVVQKHRQWLIIALREKDIPTNPQLLSDWESSYDAAVKRLRQASINVPLAIDAPQYGLDTSNLALRGSDRILADPRQNLLLNINAWWPNVTFDAIRNNISAVTNAALPLLIGEFSAYAQQSPQCTSVAFDYTTLLQVAQDTLTGWQAWSWGDASNYPCGTLDMTHGGKFANLSGWGLDVAVTNTNSIRNTSEPSTFTPGKGCR